jgi:hypothetical protein
VKNAVILDVRLVRHNRAHPYFYAHNYLLTCNDNKIELGLSSCSFCCYNTQNAVYARYSCTCVLATVDGFTSIGLPAGTKTIAPGTTTKPEQDNGMVHRIPAGLQSLKYSTLYNLRTIKQRMVKHWLLRPYMIDSAQQAYDAARRDNHTIPATPGSRPTGTLGKISQSIFWAKALPLHRLQPLALPQKPHRAISTDPRSVAAR